MNELEELELDKLSGDKCYHQAISDFFNDNEEIAQKKFSAAAEKGFFAANVWLYSLDMEDEEQREKAVQAFKRLVKLSESRDLEAWEQNDLGFCYEYGIGCEQDLVKAKFFYEGAVTADYLPAVLNLRYHYQSVKDEKNAFVYTKLAADLDHIESKHRVAQYFEKGIGCDQNVRAALSYDRQAAKGNYLPALIDLIVYYSQGAAKNLHMAFDYAKRAAKKGDANSQYYVARCYEAGRYFDLELMEGQEGLKKDLSKAFKYYNLAANQEHPEARYQLGTWYKEGKFVQADQAIAAKWFHLAAQNGHKEAQEEAAVAPVTDDAAYELNFSRVIDNWKEPLDLKLEGNIEQARLLEENAQYVQEGVEERDTQDISNPEKKLDAETAAKLRKEAEEPFIGVLAAIEVCESKTFKWRFYQRQNNQDQPHKDLTLQANLIAGLCHSQGIGGCKKNNYRAIDYYKQALEQEKTNLSASVLREAAESLSEETDEAVETASQLDTHEAIANALLCDLWRDYSEIRQVDRKDLSQAQAIMLNAKESKLEEVIPVLSRSLTDYLKTPSVESKNDFLAELEDANLDSLLGAETTGWQRAFNVIFSVLTVGLGFVFVILPHWALTDRWGLWNNDFGDKLEGLEKNVQRIIPEDSLLHVEKLVVKKDKEEIDVGYSSTRSTISDDARKSYISDEEVSRGRSRERQLPRRNKETPVSSSPPDNSSKTQNKKTGYVSRT